MRTSIADIFILRPQPLNFKKTMIRSVKFATWQIVIACIFIFQFGCKKSNNDSQTNPPGSKKWVVSTFAGGTYPQAQFNLPEALAIDSKGNLYVSDTKNFNIVKIDATGNVTYYEGTTVSPSFDWNYIHGLALDKQDNLYFITHDQIYKSIAPQNFSVFAGGRNQLYGDGQSESAGFSMLINLTISPNGNLYAVDYDKNYMPHLRMVTPAALVSTVTPVDNTNIHDSALNLIIRHPMTFDQNGNFYITSGFEDNVIKKIDSQGNVTLFAGKKSGFKDGKDSSAMFQTIHGLAADHLGNIFVSDVGNHVIRKVTPDGTVSTIAGTGDVGFADGDGTIAKFVSPQGIVVDKNGVVYVADADNNRVRKIEYK